MKDLVKFIVENHDKFEYDENNRITNLEECFIDNDVFENCNGIDFSRNKKYRLKSQPKIVHLGLSDDLVGQIVINPNYSKLQITEQHGDCVKIGDEFYTYGQLREIFTRLDGTKFEKEVV